VLISLRRPNDWSWGTTIGIRACRLFPTIGIRVRSTWRCLWSSLIFKSSMVSLILASGRLGWTSSWLRAGWRKYYSGGRKSLKTWRKKLDIVGWESFDDYSALLGEWSVGWIFYKENNNLIVEATSGPLSEEVIGESVDSEATPLSSLHAWRCTYQVSHYKFFLYYQWFR